MADNPADRERSSFPSIGESFDDPDDSEPDSSPAERERESVDIPSGATGDDDDDDGGVPGGFDDNDATGGGSGGSRDRDPSPDPSTPQTPADREDATANPGGSAGDETSAPPATSPSPPSGDGPSEGPGSLNPNPQPGADAPAPVNENLSTVPQEEDLARQFASRYDGVDVEDVDITRTAIGGDIVARVSASEVPQGVFNPLAETSPAERERRAAEGTRERRRVLDELERRGANPENLDVDVTDTGVTIGQIPGTADERGPTAAEREFAARGGVEPAPGVNPSAPQTPGEQELAARGGVEPAPDVNPSAVQTPGGVEQAFASGTAEAMARDRVEAAIREEGGDPDDYRIQTAESGEITVEREEQFGDIPVNNPLTGNRLEEDLDTAGGQLNRFLRTTAEVSTVTPQTVGPLFGPVASFAQQEENALRALDEAGVVDLDEAPNTLVRGEDLGPGFEGPVEQNVEAAFAGAATALNPFDFASELKEKGEFAVTQGPAVADVAAESTEGGVQGPVFGSEIDVSDQQQFEGGDEFEQDVARRLSQMADSAREQAQKDPIGSGASVAGGLAAGIAAGSVAGSAAARVPGISGSDLSGRVLTGTARQVDRFVGDTRGQADLTGPSARAGADDRVTLTGEDLRTSERALSEPPRDSTARPDDGDRGINLRRGDDRGGGFNRAELDERDVPRARKTLYENLERFPVERIRRFTPDEDLRRVADVERRLADDIDTSSSVFDTAVAVQTGGVFGATSGAVSATEDAAASLDESAAGAFAGASSATDPFTRTDTRADTQTGARTDTPTDTRLDAPTDVDTRIDTVVDQIFEVGVRGREDTDLRFDTPTQQDQDPFTTPTRQDSRQDIPVEFPTRFDTPTRTPDDFGFDDDRRDEDGAFSAFASAEEVFDTGVAQSVDEAFGDL